MSFNKNYKRIGDWSAGTLVIFQEKSIDVSLESESVDEKDIPKINLSVDEQQTVIAFLERSKRLSPSRQEEIANNLSAVLNAKDEAAANKLKSMANFYLGQEV